MVSIHSLDIVGYQQTPVPHHFFQARTEASSHLALLLAGQGYSSEGPVLYYPLLALLERGIDVLAVDYSHRPELRYWPGEQVRACVLADTIAAYQAVVKQHTYQWLTLVGKSLGTVVMSELFATRLLSIPVRQAIWLTPVLGDASLRQQIHQANVPSLIVIGTEDPFYRPDWLAEAHPSLNGEVVVIPQADHSLDVGLDAQRSLLAIGRMSESVCAFLDRNELAREDSIGDEKSRV